MEYELVECDNGVKLKCVTCGELTEHINDDTMKTVEKWLERDGDSVTYFERYVITIKAKFSQFCELCKPL